MKKIWLVNYYCAPPEYVANQRHLKFAYYLMEAGYDVTIISSSYLREKELDLITNENKYIEVKYGQFKFIHIKTTQYTGNGLSRMFSIFQFALRLLLLRNKFEKPDIILHNVHVPFDYLVYTCANKLKATYIVEAWDLWPDSFVRFGLINGNNLIVKMAYKIEKHLYTKAKKIIFSMEGGKDYLINRGWDKAHGGTIDLNKVCYINNGLDIDEFDLNINLYKLDDPDLEDENYFKIIYLGSIRLVNNVLQLIEAANLLKEHKDMKFLIYGDGDERQNLEKFCIDNNIGNVVFKEKWIPLKYVPYVLSNSSLNILNYMKDFGIYGVSSGKLFQYLASAHPVCCNIKMNYCEVEKNNLGIAKDFVSAQEYADAILSLKNMDKESYGAMCLRARKVAKQFDYKILSDKLIEFLN